jgi:hypothetical protein
MLAVTVTDILRAARALIEDEAHWTPGCPRFTNPQTVFCIVTALREAGGYVEGSKALRRVTSESLIHFNATHTHAEVLALFDRGIEACEASK